MPLAPRAVDAFPITEAQLTGNYFETLTYGIYLVTCCFCARTLFWIPTANGDHRLRRRDEIRWLLVCVFCFLLAVNTFDDIIGLFHNLKAFVFYRGAGGPTEELTNIRDWINITRSFTQTANMIVGDFVLIYRCFIVFGKRWKIILPSFILYLAGIAMAIKLMVVEITTTNAAITLNNNIIKPWWSAFFAITAAQNVLTTSLLVWRIWRVEHSNVRYRAGRSASLAPSQQPRLRKVIRVIAESGLAYSTLVFLTFVVSMCDSNALYPLADATLQATGITFNVIIMRSTPRRDEQFSTFDHTDRGVITTGTTDVVGGDAQQRGPAISSLHFARSKTDNKMVDNVDINVTIQTTTDRDEAEGLEDDNADSYSLKKMGEV